MKLKALSSSVLVQPGTARVRVDPLPDDRCGHRGVGDTLTNIVFHDDDHGAIRFGMSRKAGVVLLGYIDVRLSTSAVDLDAGDAVFPSRVCAVAWVGESQPCRGRTHRAEEAASVDIRLFHWCLPFLSVRTASWREPRRSRHRSSASGRGRGMDSGSQAPACARQPPCRRCAGGRKGQFPCPGPGLEARACRR